MTRTITVPSSTDKIKISKPVDRYNQIVLANESLSSVFYSKDTVPTDESKKLVTGTEVQIEKVKQYISIYSPKTEDVILRYTWEK